MYWTNFSPVSKTKQNERFITPPRLRYLLAERLRFLLFFFRPNLGFRSQVVIESSVIDRDFTGNVSVVVHNLSSKFRVPIDRGAPICQLVLERVFEYGAKEVPLETLVDNPNPGGEPSQIIITKCPSCTQTVFRDKDPPAACGK